MPKGVQRGNKEAKKPKQPKKPAPQPFNSTIPSSRSAPPPGKKR